MATLGPSHYMGSLSDVFSFMVIAHALHLGAETSKDAPLQPTQNSRKMERLLPVLNCWLTRKEMGGPFECESKLSSGRQPTFQPFGSHPRWTVVAAAAPPGTASLQERGRTAAQQVLLLLKARWVGTCKYRSQEFR